MDDPYDGVPLFRPAENAHELGRKLLAEKNSRERIRAADLLGERGSEAAPVVCALVYALRTDHDSIVWRACARALWRLARAGCPNVLEELKSNLYSGTERTALVAHVLEHAEAAVGRIA